MLWKTQSLQESMLAPGRTQMFKKSTDFYFLKCLLQEGNVRPAPHGKSISCLGGGGPTGSHTSACGCGGCNGAELTRGVLRWPGQPWPAGPPTSQQAPCRWARLPWVLLRTWLGAVVPSLKLENQDGMMPFCSPPQLCV